MIGMTKDEFISRMIEDAQQRKEAEEDRKRRTKEELNDYISMRKNQMLRYIWRKKRR